MKTILDQFHDSVDDDEAKIICHDCGNELSQWYDEAMEYIEKGRCPFCHCDGIEIIDDEPSWFKRCESCQNRQDCRRDAALAQWEAERFLVEP